MITLVYFLGFLFLLFTYFWVTSAAVSIGVKAGLAAFAQEFLPIYLATLEQLEDRDEGNEILEVLQAEENGEISEEAANIILRNMRGEK